MSFIRKHLTERHLDFSKTRVIVSDETNRATFLLFNPIGQMIGYQRYNPHGDKKIHNNDEGKYYTYIGENHMYGVWGLESIQPTDTFVFIVEGIFDAIRIHNLSLPALAILTNSPSHSLKHWFRLWGKKIIGISDNDENNSGRNIIPATDECYMVPNPYKDLGEMPDDLVEDFILQLI